ncbi:MAG: helix-turn-helix domain-containing protein [Phycisphaerales bacterium]|nr:helix-turn-helix domain-containing protein [Phycisphaerales bacterium]
MAKHIKFSDQIRRAVDASGMSRYRVSKELGITESTTSRFMAGGWLGVENMDALADLLGLQVTVKTNPAKEGPKAHGKHH